MFNPSVGGVAQQDADGDVNMVATDPTIGKLQKITQTRFPNVNGFKILNLFAFRNAYPLKLLEQLHKRGAKTTTQNAFDYLIGKICKHLIFFPFKTSLNCNVDFRY